METKSYSFKELLSVIVDNRGKTCPTSEDGLPLIATNCIKMESMYPVFDKVRYVSKETYETWFRGHPEPNDIIFVCKGSPGRVSLTPNPVSFCIAQDMLAIRANEEIIDQKFLFALLRSKRTQRKILNMHVGTLIPHFKKGDFNNLYFDVPVEKSIQKGIGEIYYTFSRKIELNRKMNETLEAMAQALFKSWFVDFDPVIDNALAAGNIIPDDLQAKADRRKAVKVSGSYKPLPKDIQNLFPAAFEYNEELGKWIPEGWEVRFTSEISEVYIGKTPPRKQAQWFEAHLSETNMPWASIRTMGKCGVYISDTEEYLTKESIAKFNVRVIPENTVILSFKLTVGRVAITTTEMCTNEAIAHFNNLKYGITSEYLYCYFKTFDYNSLGSTSSIATAVNSKIIKKMPVLIPSGRILSEYSKLIGKKFRKLFMVKNDNENLVQTRDLLLSQLISGKTRLPKSFIEQFEHKTEVAS